MSNINNPSTTRNHPRRRAIGFTLVELLVVIGIIALLISILLPALGKARRSANTVKCLANQKQLVMGLIAYSNDYKGILPYTGFFDPPKPNWLFDMGIPLQGAQQEVKNGQLWPYIGHVGVYHCAQDPGPWAAGAVANLSSFTLNGAVSGYVQNNNLGLKITRFHPDDVMFWEPALGTNGANDATNYPSEGVTVRHQHGTTVSHIDGHCDVLSGEDFNKLCQRGPTILWCDPTALDGGYSRPGFVPNPIPIHE
jgi:prepilin-type N-terminal cleavage/methylation domain-containing protein